MKINHNKRIERLRTRKKNKTKIAISVNTKNLVAAKDIIIDSNKKATEKVTISGVFDMMLEDFVFEQLSSEEQMEIEKAEVADLEPGEAVSMPGRDFIEKKGEENKNCNTKFK